MSKRAEPHKKRQEVPTSREMKKWIREAATKVNMNPAAISRKAGLSINLVASFLKSPGRDIKLDNARTIETVLREAACVAGIALRPISENEASHE